MSRPHHVSIFVSSVALTLLAIVACAKQPAKEATSESTSPVAATQEETANSQTDTPPVSQANQSAKSLNRVNIYFPKDGNIASVVRETNSQGVAKFAIAQLVQGPAEEEKQNGLQPAIALQGSSNCGEDFAIAIEEKVAKLRFCRDVVSEQNLEVNRAIEATLTQFSTVEKVAILDRNGKCLSTADNSCLAQVQPANKLTLTGLGGVEIGMTITEASQETGVQFVNQASGGEEHGCFYYKAATEPQDVSYMVTEGKIARIEVNTKNITTLSGAKIGDTEERIRALYPGKIEEEAHEYVPGGKYLFFVPEDASNQNYRVVFETNEKGIVTTMRSGKIPEVGWIEGCV
ncbi:MAG: GerMN domain-containing protein [Cyanobacteria bacterium P01_E01_bin.42]